MLNINGFTDWYLPSHEELKLMHANLYLKGKGDFKLYSYWSSSLDKSFYAIFVLFGGMPAPDTEFNADAHGVRAIRSF